MNTNEKIDKIRTLMSKRDIAAIIIPSDDPHQSEYVAGYWEARKWLTGFTGSAGIAVITQEDAILWTDFRYWIQAAAQIKGSEFTLYKMGEPDVPAYEKWLFENMDQGQTIGINGNVFNAKKVETLKKKFREKNILMDTAVDFVDLVWSDRPEKPLSQAFFLSEKFAGKTSVEKLQEIRNKMGQYQTDCHLISALDDIAWIFNLRGKDVHTNPVNIAFSLITKEDAVLFIDKRKVSNHVETKLNDEGVLIEEYETICTFLSHIKDDSTILLDPLNTSHKLYASINRSCKIVKKTNPATLLKAIKNKTEISHTRQTLVKDGTAVVKFLHWLETHVEKEHITEVSAARKLFEFRKEEDYFIDNSFDPIMAYQDHSAMCHYSANGETDVPIRNNGVFLTDSGGNYLGGTTDITRTISLGETSNQLKEDYTLVLKGHISVATAVFPKGTRGFQIDTLARQFLWEKQMDFGHGTGHGIGFFLCVHEGPHKISPNPIDVKLKKSMLLSNEPGLYREGSYGIRIENMIVVDEALENEFGQFLKFENLTLCHYEKELMDKTLLSSKEIDWINSYHKIVFEKLSPHINKEVTAWLKIKTQPIL
jgi:Xaa-Pro aminopeptidase